MDFLSIGRLVEVKVEYVSTEFEDNLWVNAIIIGQNCDSETVDVVVLNAEEENIVPLAYQVPIFHVRINEQKILKVQDTTLKTSQSAKQSDESLPKVIFCLSLCKC